MKTSSFPGIRFVGTLFTPDFPERLLAGDLPGQKPGDFGCRDSHHLTETIAVTFTNLQSIWQSFRPHFESSPTPEADQADHARKGGMTGHIWISQLLGRLDYDLHPSVRPAVRSASRPDTLLPDASRFPVSHRAGADPSAPPVHIVAPTQELGHLPERIPSASRTKTAAADLTPPRLSPHATLQQYLNHGDHLWGIVTNGRHVCLLRQTPFVHRRDWIEFDIATILEEQLFPDFAVFYRLLHRTRLPKTVADAPDCFLEKYHHLSAARRERMVERLCDGMERCLTTLANGFLAHPDNHALRARLSDAPPDQSVPAESPLTAFHRSLLRLVYRFLFLLVSEERGLIGPSPLYRGHYGLLRLRRLVDNHRVDTWHPRRADDLWESLRVLWPTLSDERMAECLGVSPLNGSLFEPLELDACHLANDDVLVAFGYLVHYQEKPGAPVENVNYASVDIEKLGAVCERLLDFYPVLDWDGDHVCFRLVFDSELRTGFSYSSPCAESPFFGYTRSELVMELLRSALDPVLAARQEASRQTAGLAWGDLPESFRHYLSTRTAQLEGTTGTVANTMLPPSPVPDPAKVWDGLSFPARERLAAEWGLLSLRVLDPACGAGHFLLAAGRKLGYELARLRTGEDEPSPEHLREAIRDVVAHCLYGVDKNPLAVELCRVALWLESHCPGKPLIFLDHRIRRGDSLIGLTDIRVLKAGLPDSAFSALSGEDPETVKVLRRRNAQERQDWAAGQETLPFEVTGILAGTSRQWAELDGTGDNTLEDVRRKKELYTELRWQLETDSLTLACHLWTAAFFQWLTPKAVFDGKVITTESIRDALSGRLAADSPVAVYARGLAQEHGFFHWPLEFPELTGARWEPTRTETLSAATCIGVAFDVILGNPPWERIKLEQKKLQPSPNPNKKIIDPLPEADLSLRIAYQSALHMTGSISRFLRASGEYPLTGADENNTYPAFAERIRHLLHSRGRAGLIVLTAIATDVTNQPFFADLMQKGQLVSLFDFDNLKGLFPDLISLIKFSLLTLAGGGHAPIRPQFAFFCHSLEDLRHPLKLVSLSEDDLAQIAPNTGTLPTFRTRQDADLTRAVYAHIPVLVNRQTHNNPWGLHFWQMFTRLKDTRAFGIPRLMKERGYRLVGNRLMKDESIYLPVYCPLLVSQFNHRHLTSTNNLQTLSLEQLRDHNFLVHSLFFVSQDYFRKRMENLPLGCTTGLLGYVDLGRCTDERTAQASIIPWGPTAAGLILSSGPDAVNLCLLCATYNSLVFDYLLKQLLSEISALSTIPPSVFEQVAAPPPSVYTPADIAFIVPRVLELTCTAWDMKPFADDVWSQADEKLRSIIRFWWEDNQAACEKWRMEDGKCRVEDEKLKVENKKWEIENEWWEVENGMLTMEHGQWKMRNQTKPDRKKRGDKVSLSIPDSPSMPFVWDETRRARIRAELDAYYAGLYGLTRKQLRYILDPADLTERELENICDPWEEVSDPLDPAGYAARTAASRFPGETFRALKQREMRQFGEYRTRRLVLEAWLSGIGESPVQSGSH